MAALLLLVAVALLLRLSWWQVERLEWKEGLIASRDAAMQQAAVPLQLPLAAGVDWAFRRVVVDANIKPPILRLYGRNHQGQPGAHLLGAVVANGQSMWLDLGWVPLAVAESFQLRAPLRVQAEFQLRPPTLPPWFATANSPTANKWLHVDLPAMSAAAALPPPAMLYGEALTAIELDAVATMPAPSAALLRNNHLQYAIFWAVAAVILGGLGLYAAWPRGSE